DEPLRPRGALPGARRRGARRLAREGAGTRVSAAAVAADRKRLGRPSGWWGMLLLIATEGALFALLIASYYYLRFSNVRWPLPGDPGPKLVVPLVLTAVLVATSAPMQLALAAAER